MRNFVGGRLLPGEQLVTVYTVDAEGVAGEEFDIGYFPLDGENLLGVRGFVATLLDEDCIPGFTVDRIHEYGGAYYGPAV